MRPDDPRHGTYAGAMRHWKDGEKPCPSCATEASRVRKRSQLNALRHGPRRVELGQQAWEIVRDMPRNLLSAKTGMRHPRLREYELGGPRKRVHCTTRSRILAAGGHWTPLGMQRRLQALSAIGWSMRAVSKETGIDLDALKRLRRREAPKFIRMTTAEAILKAYDRLQMKTPPAGSATTKIRKASLRNGWLPPLAWDDIDDPTEQPELTDAPRAKTDLDHAVVERVIRGERLSMTRAERLEVVRRLRDDWGWSEERIETHTGISKSTNRDRYPTRPQEDAA